MRRVIESERERIERKRGRERNMLAKECCEISIMLIHTSNKNVVK